MRRQYSEPEYTRQIYELGRWYNDALLGVETNFSTYPNAKLQEMGYPRLYVREREDSYTGKLRESYGFRTDRVTRPRIIAGLVEVFESNPESFTDKSLLREMLRFVYNEDHRPEAIAGEHDDLVMAAAIGYAIRWQQASEDKQEKKRKKHPAWTEDMWADYRGASPEMQELMRKEWGDPA